MTDDESILVDCDSCEVRGNGCEDCFVTVLMGAPPEVRVDSEERRALQVLAASGLVPPLRMVVATDGPDTSTATA